jgi:superfamily II RNA helicase
VGRAHGHDPLDTQTEVSEPRRLHHFLPKAGPGTLTDPDTILEHFLEWASEKELTLYPEQEEAILELLADRHVVLSTPTGSGKSLVALALHWKGLCEGRRSFYTAPVKALVSEKFFDLCEEFGPEQVGMLTGDASVNHDAPVICCTTEVLANMALRNGQQTDAPYVVLDEFHYYADRDRGVSWQIPLITLPHTLFLMMSATVGNTAQIEERLSDFSRREVAHVHSDVRPVPLDFEYRETSLHQTLEDLHSSGRSPIYVVNFTQRECGDLAQGSTSTSFCTGPERKAIAQALAEARFDTPYGKDIKRFLGHGIGVHHAGLLPKYRLLVEQLAQQGHLKVIFGTDTLGVGVNIPIRTVVFTRLSKFDGEKVGILSIRDFKQIAGRAGRRGFDVQGSVICQAPEHIIENKRIEQKNQGGKKKPRKPAPKGFVAWNEDTFQALVEKPSEALESRFEMSHGMLLSLLQRSTPADYSDVIEVVDRSHESKASKSRQRRRAAQIFRDLRRAGIAEIVEASFGPPEIQIADDLQSEFSLHQTLSLYLVAALEALDAASPTFSLDVLSLVEAIQENPRPILSQLVWDKKRELIAQLKAEGVEYDERQRKLEDITWDKPLESFLHETFNVFAEHHPWVGGENVRPKSIAREMFEDYRSFDDYVKEYGLSRSEGLLLRYLSQVHNTLVKSVPQEYKTDAVLDAIAFLRTLLQVDSSMVDAWEDLVDPTPAARRDERQAAVFDLAQQSRALVARIRSEMLILIRALSQNALDEAVALVAHDPDDRFDTARFKAALGPYFEDYDAILFTPEARRAHHTRIDELRPRVWSVTQVLVDPAGDNFWAVHGEVDLTQERDREGPLVRIERIGT